MFGPLASQLGPLGRASGRRSYVEKVKALAPIAYWPLNELSGTTAVDASGNGRNGTHVNATIDQPGFSERSVYYNGTNAHTNIFSMLSSFNGQTGSVHCAFQIPGAWNDGSERYAFYISPNGGLNTFYLRKNGNGALVAARVASGSAALYIPGNLNTTNWVRFALTWNQPTNQYSCYINGVAMTNAGATMTVWSGTITDTDRCNLGSITTSSAAANRWLGSIDDVAIWDRSLSASEVASLAVAS